MPPKKKVTFPEGKGIELNSFHEVDHREDYDRAYRHGYGDPPDDEPFDETFFLNAARVVVVCIAALFAVGYLAGNRSFSRGGGSGGNSRASENPEKGNAFAVSSGYLRDVQESLQGEDLAEKWTGGASVSHADECVTFGELLKQVADTGDGVQAAVRGQGRQVDNGREFLDNVFTGVESAMPVAEALYWSGPAGPMLSYQYQLAVANPAVGTSVNKDKYMHDSAQKNAEDINVLTRHYDALANQIIAF